jgi:hypothetical protein
MKKIYPRILLLLPLFFALASCGIYQQGIRTGWEPRVYPPNPDPRSISVFSGSQMEKPYEEIALVVAYSDLDESDREVLGKLRTAAADFGADAVVDLRFNVIQSTVLQARGIAVKYKEGK